MQSRKFRFYSKQIKELSPKRSAHNLPHSVYYRWKRPFNTGRASLIKLQFNKAEPELRALQEENAKLKKIIGNQALEQEFKDRAFIIKIDAHE